MAKENLFEKFTLEETKSVLQEISEYMDQVINNDFSTKESTD